MPGHAIPVWLGGTERGIGCGPLHEPWWPDPGGLTMIEGTLTRASERVVRRPVAPLFWNVTGLLYRPRDVRHNGRAVLRASTNELSAVGS